MGKQLVNFITCAASRVHPFCNLPSRCEPTFYFIIFPWFSPTIWRGRGGRDRMLIGFTITHAISAYPTDIESSNPAQAKCTTLCDKVCQWLAAGRLFSSGTLVSSTNKIDRHEISEILIESAIKQHKPNQPTLKITNNETKLGFLLDYVRVMMFNATFNNICHIVAVSFYWWRKPKYLEKNSNLSQVTDKHHHIMFTMFIIECCSPWAGFELTSFSGNS